MFQCEGVMHEYVEARGQLGTAFTKLVLGMELGSSGLTVTGLGHNSHCDVDVVGRTNGSL